MTCTTKEWKAPERRRKTPLAHRRFIYSRSPEPVASGSHLEPIVVDDDPLPPTPLPFELTEEARPIFPQKVHGQNQIRTNLAAISIKKHKYQLLEIRAREALGLGPFEIGSIEE